MVDLLKKIGIPATVAAIIATIITLLPFIFKLDERYAKASDLEQETVVLNKQITELSVEIGRLAGTQEVLIAILASRNDTEEAEETDTPVVSTTAASAPEVAAGQPPPIAVISTEPPQSHQETRDRLEQVSKEVKVSRERAQIVQERSESHKK